MGGLGHSLCNKWEPTEGRVTQFWVLTRALKFCFMLWSFGERNGIFFVLVILNFYCHRQMFRDKSHFFL